MRATSLVWTRNRPRSRHRTSVLKRKVRNYVALTRGCVAPNDIYVKDRGILAHEQRRAFQALGVEPTDRPNLDARRWMCPELLRCPHFRCRDEHRQIRSGREARGVRARREIRQKGAEAVELRPGCAVPCSWLLPDHSLHRHAGAHHHPRCAHQSGRCRCLRQ